MATTRDPQGKHKTAATAAGVGLPLAFLLGYFFPDMEPQNAVGFTALFAWAASFVGSTARDWIHEMEASDPPERPGFWIRKVANIG